MNSAGPSSVAVAAPDSLLVRPVQPADFDAWLPLWEGYNAFYGRQGSTALPGQITETTWARFFDPDEPVFALVAQAQERLVGLAHHLLHRSTIRIEPTCYLQDLFTEPASRGQGVARLLIDGVYQACASAGVRRVYWQTHESNAVGRRLYDQVARHKGFIVYGRDL